MVGFLHNAVGFGHRSDSERGAIHLELLNLPLPSALGKACSPFSPRCRHQPPQANSTQGTTDVPLCPGFFRVKSLWQLFGRELGEIVDAQPFFDRGDFLDGVAEAVGAEAAILFVLELVAQLVELLGRQDFS